MGKLKKLIGPKWMSRGRGHLDVHFSQQQGAMHPKMSAPLKWMKTGPIIFLILIPQMQHERRRLILERFFTFLGFGKEGEERVNAERGRRGRREEKLAGTGCKKNEWSQRLVFLLLTARSFTHAKQSSWRWHRFGQFIAQLHPFNAPALNKHEGQDCERGVTHRSVYQSSHDFMPCLAGFPERRSGHSRSGKLE